jgi:hypothetical protein
VNTFWSRTLVIAPALFLLVIGVSSVAFAWGASSAKPAPVMSPRPSTAARGNLNPQAPGPGAAAANLVAGTVASKTESTLVVMTTAGKSVTVDVTSSTQYSVRGVAGATIANIAVGSTISVQGGYQSDGTFNATTIQSGRIRGGRGSGGDGGGTRPQPSAGASVGSI